MLLEILSSIFLTIFSLILLLFIKKNDTYKKSSSSSSSSVNKLPKSYPVIGMTLSLIENKDRQIQWISDLIASTPTSTFILHRALGMRQILTANPSNVQHILKTKFHLYEKGDAFRETLSELLGSGIFNADGSNWKFQRQVASHEFNTKSLRKFIETVVDTELSDRLIPILSAAAANKTVLDLQDILQRFAFDNICKIAFGYDPAYLSPSLPQERFAQAFEDAARLSAERSTSMFPIVWKIKRLLTIGSEKQLKAAVPEIQEFAKNIIREKKQELEKTPSTEPVDLLSRFLTSGHSDEDFVRDIVISFILAGRDTTSAALTWFFWLISKNSKVESEIIKEIKEKCGAPAYEEVKDMVYTHASLCESMRLYPPVPADSKEVIADDVLPDGIVVKKGMSVAYHPYAMGRSEKLWGIDWAEYKPERWLEKDPVDGKWGFVARDQYIYPVFQAGPRICMGKEMAFLQMKRVVASVLRRFKVVPVAAEEGVEPAYISYLTSKMEGVFPVKVQERCEEE